MQWAINCAPMHASCANVFLQGAAICLIYSRLSIDGQASCHGRGLRECRDVLLHYDKCHTMCALLKEFMEVMMSLRDKV